MQHPIAAPAPPQVARPTRRLFMLGAVCLGLAGVAAMRAQVAAGADDVPPAEAQARAAHVTLLGPLPLQVVQPGQIGAAAQEAGLSPAEQAALLADVQGGRAQLVWLTLYDSDAEDGDVAELRSAGFSRVVPLARTPVTVAVPVGTDRTILLVGSVDGGGGGVTVGVVLSSGPMPLPPLSVGQTIRLPVGPG